MKTKGVIGHKIVKVVQSVRPVREAVKHKCNCVDYLELDNGLRLIPITVETDFGYYEHKFVVKRSQ
jgi:hypothetical protein